MGYRNGIDRVLDKFLNDVARSLHDFTGGDLFSDGRSEDGNRMLREECQRVMRLSNGSDLSGRVYWERSGGWMRVACMPAY